jgi:HAD superfamily hydrolase (TIGR01509 family)
MKWIRSFQLFLFDFDGLLVNTEHLHYQAYVNMLAARGCKVGWSFLRFCELAHYDSHALRTQIYVEFPDLEPNWEILYGEKKKIYFDLISSGKVELMPGAEKLLRALEKENIRRCVVTNSLFEQIQLLRSQHPILQTIPKWITREDYGKPKPDPECYLRAIQLYGHAGDKIIGFEDSIRGLEALRQTPALPVLICPFHHPLLEIAAEGGVIHYESLAAIPEEKIV